MHEKCENHYKTACLKDGLPFLCSTSCFPLLCGHWYGAFILKWRPEAASPPCGLQLDGRCLGNHRNPVHAAAGPRAGTHISSLQRLPLLFLLFLLLPPPPSLHPSSIIHPSGAAAAAAPPSCEHGRPEMKCTARRGGPERSV